MRNFSHPLVFALSLGAVALGGCAVADDGPAALTSDESDLQSLRKLVIGEYGSALGHISLREDGTYVGGYVTEGDPASAAGEQGRYFVRRAPIAVRSGAILSNAELTLMPDGDAGTKAKVHALTVLGNRDIVVARAGISQIWVRQAL
jgi:hypothetical protein